MVTGELSSGQISFTADEIGCVMPAPGRYLASVQSVQGLPQEVQPVRICIHLQILHPVSPQRLLLDVIPLRDPQTGPLERLAGTRRLLDLLALAGVEVQPDTPVDLGVIVGIHVLVDVGEPPGGAGYPSSTIVSYAAPARPGSRAETATTAGDRNHPRGGQP